MTPPEENFSYEADIAPRTTSFFRGLASDPVLDPAAKRKLATSFFSDVSQIRDIRQKNELFPIRKAQEELQLESARFSLERARKQADDDDKLGSLGTEADYEMTGILDDPDLLPEEKAAALQRSHFETLRKLPPSAAGAASWLSRKFGAAMGVVKPQAQNDFTPSQIARFVADGGDPAVIETGDPVLIGRSMADVAERKKLGVAAEAEAKAREVEQRLENKSFLDALNSVTDIDFAVDEDTGKVDETRFAKGDIQIPKIKRALALSPDPAIRKLALEAGDNAKKLRGAYLKANESLTAPAAAPRVVLPPRP